MRAGHLPKVHFGLSHWQNMRVFEPKNDWDWPGDGYYRFRIKGRPCVGYCAPLDSNTISFAVRPIVRVPMNRSIIQ